MGKENSREKTHKSNLFCASCASSRLSHCIPSCGLLCMILSCHDSVFFLMVAAPLLCTAISRFACRLRRFNAEAQRFTARQSRKRRRSAAVPSRSRLDSVRAGGTLERPSPFVAAAAGDSRAPMPHESCSQPASKSAYCSAESSFSLRFSAFLCVSALSPVWSWLRLGRAALTAVFGFNHLNCAPWPFEPRCKPRAACTPVCLIDGQLFRQVASFLHPARQLPVFIPLAP